MGNILTYLIVRKSLLKKREVKVWQVKQYCLVGGYISFMIPGVKENYLDKIVKFKFPPRNLFYATAGQSVMFCLTQGMKDIEIGLGNISRNKF